MGAGQESQHGRDCSCRAGLCLQREWYPSGIQMQACPARACAMALPNICELLLEVGMTPVCMFSNKTVHLLLPCYFGTLIH